MSDLVTYVHEHTQRGECQCGLCLDKGNQPDPTGHTANMIFFVTSAINDPDAETLRTLINEHKGDANQVDLFDGKEHGYMELGGWIGDQGLAMQLMGLGKLVGLWDLLTPETMGMPKAFHMEMAGQGLVAMQAKVEDK